MKTLLFTLMASLCFLGSCYADSPNNEKTGQSAKLMPAAKAYFDVTGGEPKLLLLRLQLIEKTYHDLAAAGTAPVFVVGIRGKASIFFTKDDDYVIDTDLPDKEKIAVLVKKLAALQINFEQCRIAAGLQDIETEDFLPEVKLVANGYASMIRYQAQGYGLVPMD